MVSGSLDVRRHARGLDRHCMVLLDSGEPGASIGRFTSHVLVGMVATHTKSFFSVWTSPNFKYRSFHSQWGQRGARAAARNLNPSSLDWVQCRHRAISGTWSNSYPQMPGQKGARVGCISISSTGIARRVIVVQTRSGTLWRILSKCQSLAGLRWALL